MATELELKLSLTPEIDVAKLNVLIASLKKSLGPLGDKIEPIDADKLNKELGRVAKDAKVAATEIDKIGEVSKKVIGSASGFERAFKFNTVTDAVRNVSDSLKDVLSVGNEYEATLAAVGAVTGQSGDGLDKLGTAARDLATTFGSSASSNLKSFQGILSKFGPQVAENAEALKSMGETVNLLSAASGDAADVSMAALTDTMLQLGLVSGDAAKDADTMRQVSDALAASAKVGAAEIPQVAQSILQAGVAAKGAKLALGETTAAIQVLAVGGKTGSEAGVALRNVLGMLQKQSGPGAAALRDMGLSVEQLGETLTTKGLAPTLELLKEGLDKSGSAAERNARLMTLFGAENSSAAGIMLDNLGLFGEFTDGINKAVQEGAQGADGTLAQASARLGTAETIANKFKATIQDVFISVQSALGSGVSGALTAVSDIAPTVSTLSNLQKLLPADMGKNAVEFGKSLLSKVVPSIATTATASGAGATAFQAMWAAATGPVGLVLAGLAAVVVATKVISDMAHETAAEKLEEQKAETAILEEQRKAIEVRQQQALSTANASGEYGKLIEAQKKAVAATQEEGLTQEQQASRAKALEFANAALRDRNLELAESMPGVIDSTKEYGVSLEELKAKSDAGASEMIRLAGEVNKLDKQIGQAKTIELNLAVAVSGEDLETELTEALDKGFGDSAASAVDALTKGDFSGALKEGIMAIADPAGLGNEVSEFLFGTSFERKASEGLVSSFKDKIFNAKSADEIAAAQAEMISKIALDGDKMGIDKKEQQKVIASVRAMGDAKLKALEEQKVNEENLTKETTETLSKAFVDAVSAGKSATQTTKELAEAFGISGEKVREIALGAELEKVSAAGGDTEKAVDHIAKTFGVSKEEAARLLAQQKKNTEEAKNTASSVADIASAYKESFDANKKLRDDGIEQEIALRQKIETLSRNDPERARLTEELAALRKNNRERDREFDREDSRQKAIRAQYDEKKGKEESLFKALKGRYDLQAQVVERTAEEADLAQAEQIAAAGRKKSTDDELASQERAIQAIKDKIELAKKVGLINETGQVAIKIKDASEQATAEEFVANLNNDLRKANLKLTEINLKAKLDASELERTLREADLDMMAEQVEQGLMPSTAFIAELEKELERINGLIVDADATAKLELTKEQKKYQSQIDKLREEDYKKALTKLKEQSDAEMALRKQMADEQASMTEALINAASSASELSASSRRDELLSHLDDLHSREEISEADYNNRKQAAEEEFQKKLSAIKDREAGYRLAAQNKADAAMLEARKKALEQELALAEGSGDVLGAKKIGEELGLVNDELQNKGDDMQQIVSLLSGGLQEGMSAMFDGDTDVMKESMKKTLSTIAGFLSQLAEAAILELLLASAPIKAAAAALGVFAPVALFAFKKIISLGVRQLVDPVLSGIASFPTGAVFDSPTLAIVGDGARLGGSNREYLLRNDQIKALLSEVSTTRDNETAMEIRALRAELASVQTRLVARGADLFAVVERTADNRRSRSRAMPVGAI